MKRLRYGVQEREVGGISLSSADLILTAIARGNTCHTTSLQCLVNHKRSDWNGNEADNCGR